MRVNKKLADEAVEALKTKSRTEAVYVASEEVVALKRFKNLMIKHSGRLKFQGLEK